MTKTEEIANEFVKKFPVLFTEEADWWASEINLMLIHYFEHIREEAAKNERGAAIGFQKWFENQRWSLGNMPTWNQEEQIRQAWCECARRFSASIRRMPVP